MCVRRHGGRHPSIQCGDMSAFGPCHRCHSLFIRPFCGRVHARARALRDGASGWRGRGGRGSAGHPADEQSRVLPTEGALISDRLASSHSALPASLLSLSRLCVLSDLCSGHSPSLPQAEPLKVVEDCTAALAISPNSIKASHRGAEQRA